MILKLFNILMVGAFVGFASTPLAQDFGVTGLTARPSAPVAQPALPTAYVPNASLAATPNAALPASVGGAYTLGTGDKVRMTVYGEEELSGEFEVDSTGALSLPLIGEVQVNGSTLRDTEKLVGSKLSAGYLVNPRVNLEVLNFRPFFILGEVNKPGSYPYVNGMTVINAVALAGGYTPRAKTGQVLVKRAADTNRDEAQTPEDATIFPGDIIRVDERFF